MLLEAGNCPRIIAVQQQMPLLRLDDNGNVETGHVLGRTWDDFSERHQILGHSPVLNGSTSSEGGAFALEVPAPTATAPVLQ